MMDSRNLKAGALKFQEASFIPLLMLLPAFREGKKFVPKI
jgi:hypothetical protein